MTAATYWLVLGLALLMACPPSSAEAEPEAEAAPKTDPEPTYEAEASKRSISRFDQSRAFNLGLTRNNDYQTRSGTNQFGTTNQFGLNSQLGSTGYQADQIGLRNSQFGTNQIGTSGLGTSQYGTNGVGTTRFGTNGLGTNQFGTNGVGSTRFGTGRTGSTQFGTTGTARFGAGLGSSQFGTTGVNQFGTNQFGTGGLATSRFGASGLTSNNHFGTNQLGANRLRTNQFGTTGLGSTSSQFGTNQNTRFGTNQFGSNRFGSNQYNRNNFQDGILSHRSENDGSGLYNFAYETDTGISHQESGQPQGLGSYGVRGSYSYTSPEGVPVTVNYIADENGFQVDSPNVPAIPAHSQRQILAAEELRRQGLVDNYGNVRTDQRNQFQTSNLHNLVNHQNTNAFGTGSRRFSGSSNFAGGFNRNNNQVGFGSQGFNSQGNFLGTTVVRRRIPYPQDEASIAAFNRQALQTYGRDDTRGSLFLDDQRLLNDNTILRGGLYNQNNYGGLGQNYNLGQAGYSNLDTNSDQDFVRVIDNLNQRLMDGNSRRFSNRLGRAGPRFGEYTSQGFVSPVFQQQTASRLAIQEGGNSRFPFGRLRNLRFFDNSLSSHSDLYHASDLSTGVGGRGASYVFKS